MGQKCIKEKVTHITNLHYKIPHLYLSKYSKEDDQSVEPRENKDTAYEEKSSGNYHLTTEKNIQNNIFIAFDTFLRQ